MSDTQVGSNADDSEVTAVAVAEDVEESEELLVEEISIDGMCGVY
jgi:mycofactocin precursor